MEGKTEEKRVEEAHESVQDLRRCKHRGHVSFVLGERGRCSLDHECPECVEEKLRIEPRRLFRHLAAKIPEHRRAHRSGYDSS